MLYRSATHLAESCIRVSLVARHIRYDYETIVDDGSPNNSLGISVTLYE